jgi:hypothetical protein
VLVPFGTNAHAQEETSGSKSWQYDIAPYYLWAVGLDGEATVMGSTSDVDVSFSDILDQLEFMFDFHFEARHENGWGYIVEPLFLILESEGSAPAGTVTVETNIAMLEGMVTNRLGASEHGFNLLWGTRYLRIENEISPVLLPTIEGEQDWLDAVVGLRYAPRLSKKWSLTLRGDVGAGGSDFTWQASALAFVDLSKRTQLAFGYRHLDIDYEDGSGSSLFRFDASLSGPIMGININF